MASVALNALSGNDEIVAAARALVRHRTGVMACLIRATASGQSSRRCGFAKGCMDAMPPRCLARETQAWPQD